MEDILIRKARLEELPKLLEFEQGIIKAERPFDETLEDDPISYYDLKALIESPEAEVIVAQLNGELVGSAYAQKRKSMPYLKHKYHAYLGYMFVSKEHRRKGINQLIIGALINWSKRKGLTELRLDVYDENDAAVRAYQKAGFSKYLINMRMGL